MSAAESHTKEVKNFDAEVGKILHLMIHSLYTDKGIFIRELISNASDACDKLRYLSQTDQNLISDDPNFKILIEIDQTRKAIIIQDNGIGMDRQELIENLGTIARSGTQNFVQNLSGEMKNDTNLIGQFGVGFYSAFMVSDKVQVISRKALQSDVFSWQSEGKGEYIIESFEGNFARGTQITLYIKPEAEEYLDHFRLKHLIKNYSDHIATPIFFINSKADPEIQLNSTSALWMRSKAEISHEQYAEFYKNISYSSDMPWMVLHNKNEGAVEFTNLLFIPTDKTFDSFHPDRKRRVKLYIKRVFISDENIDLIPHFLRFLRGVVDSEDLPLNVSRETLQHNAVLTKIKNAITKRVISELKKKKQESFDEFERFWHNFGSVLKEGLCEPNVDHNSILEISIFRSALHNKMITLDEYIASCGVAQKVIYCFSGESATKLINHPQIEGFLRAGIDVLLFTDPVDDFWVNVNNKYKDFEIKSVTRSEIDIKSHMTQNDVDSDTADNEEKYEDLKSYFKSVLKDSVSDVKISKKLSESAACLAVKDQDMDIKMERFLIEQKQLAKSSSKILEINPKHNVVSKIYRDIISGAVNNSQNELLVLMIFDQACIIDGEQLHNSLEFAKRLDSILECYIK